MAAGLVKAQEKNIYIRLVIPLSTRVDEDN